MKTNNRLSILYAEGNEESCLMLKTLLGFSGIDVMCVGSVRDAFRAAQDNHFDLYLLDNRFSDGSGLKLCQQLHELNPQTPIVFYSGDAYESDRLKGLGAGANAYLIKPISDTVAPTIFKLVAPVTKNTRQWAN